MNDEDKDKVNLQQTGGQPFLTSQTAQTTETGTQTISDASTQTITINTSELSNMINRLEEVSSQARRVYNTSGESVNVGSALASDTEPHPTFGTHTGCYKNRLTGEVTLSKPDPLSELPHQKSYVKTHGIPAPEYTPPDI